MKILETMNDYFFDTYAIIEIIKGNEKYNFVSGATIITSPMNLAEVYYALLLLYEKSLVEDILKKLDFQFLGINPELAKSAALFRHQNKKLELSYIDCIGYVLALNSNLIFLTGDKGFAGFDKVLIVK